MASRDYTVNYDITVTTGNSLAELSKLIQPIQQMKSGLDGLTRAINEFNSTVNNLRLVADKMSFKPQVDLSGFRDAMASMEVNAKETAMRIRNAMERTLVGSKKDFEKSVSLLGANNFKEASAGFDRDISSLKSKLQLIDDIKTKINSRSADMRSAATERLDLWSKGHSGLDPFKALQEELRAKGYGNILNADKGKWNITDLEKFKDFRTSVKQHMSTLEELQESHLEMAAKRSALFDKTMAPLNGNKGFSSILGISGDELKKQAEAFTDIHKIFSNMPEGGMKIDISMKLTGLDAVKTELEAKVNQLQEIANKRSVIIKSLYEDLSRQKTTTVKPPMPAPPKGMTQDYMFRDDKRMINDKEIMSGRTGWSSEEIESLRQRYDKNVKLRNQYAQQLRAWRNDPGQMVTEPANIPMTFLPKIDMSKLEGEINSTFSKLMSLAKEHSVSIPVKLNPSEKIHEELIKGIGQLQKIADKSHIKVGIKAEAITDKTGRGTSAISGISKIQEEAGKALSVKISIDNKGIESAVTNSISRLQKLADKSSVRIRAVISQNSSGFDLNQSLMRIQKMADQHPVLLKAVLSKNSAGFDLNQSLSKIQKLADQHPILLRAVLSKNSGGFDVQQSLLKIQKLADQRPILLRVTLSKNNGGFDLQQSLARLQKLADKTPIRLNAKLTVSKTDINEQIKKFKPTINAKINLTWGGAAEKSAQLKKMESKLPALKVTLNLTEAETALNKLAAKIKAMNPVAMATGGNANTNSATQIGSGGGGSRSVASRPKMADSSKSQWYTLLGNTSYGANTPIAVDMFKGMGMMYGVSGAMGVLTDAFTQAVQYQNTMETAKAILKDSYKGSNFMSEYDSMARQARDVAVKTKFTAAQTADAVRFMSMAGLDMSTIKSSIAPIADIAVIGDNDLGEVADKMTNIQTAFKIKPNEMRKVADMLAKTFTSTNTDMMMLANSMEYAAPMASMANWKKGATGSLAEALAMIGIMGNSGIQASMAGTTTRMMYQNILKTTKDQRKYWDALGIKLKDSDGSPRNMIDLLTELSNKLDIKSEAGKAVLPNMVANLFRVTASSGAAAAVQNIDKIRALAEANKAAEGNSAEISMAKQNTIQGMWHQVTSAFTEGIVKVFEQNDFQQFIREKLGELKKYFASPEFVQSLQTVMDMLKDLVGVFGTFAKYWLLIYENFGDLAKNLIIAQGFLTQVGYVIKPFMQLINFAKSVFGIQNTSIGNAVSGTLFDLLISSGSEKLGKIAQMGDNDILRRGVSMGKIKRWDALKAAYASGYLTQTTAFATSFGIGKMFSNGILNVAKALGMLTGPIGFAGAAIAGFGKIVYDSYQRQLKANEGFQKLAEKNKGTVKDINDSIKPIKNALFTSLGGNAINDPKTIRQRYNGNPMLRNTVGFSDIFKADSAVASGLYSKTMYEQHIAPVSEYLFGRKISQKEFMQMATKGGSTMNNMGVYTLPSRPEDTKSFAQDMASRAAVIQAAFNSKEFKDANKKLNTAYLNAMMSDSPVEYSYSVLNQKIAAIRDQFANWRDMAKLGNNIGSIRANDVLQIQEARKALYQYFDRMMNDPQNPFIQKFAYMDIAKNGIANNDFMNNRNFNTILSAIPVTFKDALGNNRSVNLKFDKGIPVWNDMFEELKKWNIKFDDNANNRKIVLLDILEKLSNQLPGMAQVIDGLGGLNVIAQRILENLPYDPMVHAAAQKNAEQWMKDGGQDILSGKPIKDAINNANDQPKFVNSLTPMWGNFKNTKKVSGKKNNGIMIFDPTLPLYDMANNGKQNNADNKVTGKANVPPIGNGKRSPYADLTDQSAYKSKYARQGARPTQIVINIDKLANFDKTQFLTADQKTMANTLQQDIAQAVAMAFAQIAPSFNAFASNEIG